MDIMPSPEQLMMPASPASIGQQGIMPMPNIGMSDTIASMRWENDPLIINLRVRLGGYQVVATTEGGTQLQRTLGPDNKPVSPPLINDVGIDRLVATIHGVVNPVVALSNIDDTEANLIISQVLKSVLFDLVYNKDRWDVHDGDRHTIMNVMKSLVFMQFKRPVSGHEAKNFRTQTVEQNVQQSMNTPPKSGGIFPFSWKK